MKGSLPAIVFLLRKTGLTFSEIRQLGWKQFVDLFEEAAFQESVEEYKTASYVASLLATIANTVPRKGGSGYKTKDFLGMKEPKRKRAGEETDPKAELEALASRFGIKLPARELRDL